jgi:hypothetical protein
VSPPERWSVKLKAACLVIELSSDYCEEAILFGQFSDEIEDSTIDSSKGEIEEQWSK